LAWVCLSLWGVSVLQLTLLVLLLPLVSLRQTSQKSEVSLLGLSPSFLFLWFLLSLPFDFLSSLFYFRLLLPTVTYADLISKMVSDTSALHCSLILDHCFSHLELSPTGAVVV
jgi:hypothetical protein